MDREGFISYFDVWRAIKGLHIRSFNLDSRDVENVILRIVKLKERDTYQKRQAAGDFDENEAQRSGTQIDIKDDFEKEHDFKRQLKNEILASNQDS